MENLAGHSIKGYDLQERIGTGGFGAVYRAYQSTIGREVAVKIILPGFANHPDFIRRFESEAQIVARLEHPYITPLFDYWRDPDGAYLVMRWLRGGSLRDVLRKQPFDAEGAALLLDQITAALSVAHRNNVIHRDLKPGNILLDEDGNAYLADFGIAKDIGTSSNTEIDAIVGSPDYLSPEQARSEPVTPQTDVYSLGVVLYEMLTGQHPFPGLSAIERLYKHLSDPLPPIIALPDSTCDSINEVIQKATAKNPAHRYADAPAMAAAFRAAIRLQQGQNVVETLTQREQEILQRVIAGQSNRQIAADLVVTVGTVKWYITQIYRKLNVRSRVQAIVRARELNLIVNESTPGAAVSLTTIPTDDFNPENPYKGLRSFQAADYRDFFGREKLVDKLLKRMGEVGDMTRFMAVVGPSGSGKSSLVRAGLIPALWRGELHGSEKWFIVEMIPGTHPLDELEIALTKIAANQSINVREHLERDARGLLRVGQLILPDDGSELVLVIDQFEEVFTLLENEEARVHFLDLLYAAATEPRSRLRVIITLRADFYDRPLHYPQFGELVRSRLETLLPLSAEGLERAIVRPAEQVGVMFEPGLVAAIIGDVNYQPGVLPLLQYALTELFESRSGRLLTHEAYQAIGGTVGALAKRAEEVYEGLDEAGRELVRQLFLRLVTLGEGVEDTRRRTARSELTAITHDTDLMDEAIDTFAAYRLLSLDTDPGTRTPTVEVAHEALLREWERLRLWLNDSRDEIKLQRQLAVMAEEWQSAKQDVSFLASGSRLEQFEVWAAQTGLALTSRERGYLNASIAERERQTALEMVRQAREKSLERRSQTFLRGLVAVLLVGVLSLGIATGVAINRTYAAEEAAVLAANNAEVAQANFIQAEGQRLASAANVLLPGITTNAEIAALLAIRSLETGYSIQADEALTRASELLYTEKIWEGYADNSLTYAPDGRTVAFAPGHDVLLRDVESGEVVRRFLIPGVYRLAYSPDSKHLATARGSGRIQIWDINTGDELFHLQLPIEATEMEAVSYSPDGRQLLIRAEQNEADTIYLWDITTNTQVASWEARGFTAEFSPDGEYIVIDDGHSANIWSMDGTEPTLMRRLEGHTAFIWSIKVSPDSRLILTGCQDGSARIWDANTGEELTRMTGHQGGILKVAFSPDGKQALTAGLDNTARIWDVQSGLEVRHLTGHQSFIYGAVYSPDGQHVVTSSYDGSIRFWNAGETPSENQISGTRGEVYLVSVSSDGNHLMLLSATGGELWELSPPRLVRSLPDVMSISEFAADGRHILLMHRDPYALQLWDIETDTFYPALTPPSVEDGEVIRIILSPDGHFALTSGYEAHMFQLWDTRTGDEIHIFTGDFGEIMNFAFTPGQHSFLTAHADGMVRTWDMESYEEVHALQATGEFLKEVDFSPDGQRIAIAWGSGIALIIDAETGDLLQTLRHEEGIAVDSVRFSASGELLLTGAFDGTVRLWDVTSGQEMRRFIGHSGGVFDAEFSADGRYIYSGAQEGIVRRWFTDYRDQIADICARLFRDFTNADRIAYNIPDNHPTCPNLTTAPREWETLSGSWYMASIPRHWARDYLLGIPEAGDVYFRDDRTILVFPAPYSGTEYDAVSALVATSGGEIDEPFSTLEANGLTWTLYRTYLRTRAQPGIAAVTGRDGTAYMLGFLAEQVDIDSFYDTMLLPVLETIQIVD